MSPAPDGGASSTMTPADPHAEYTGRLQARRAEAQRLTSLHIRIGYLRVAEFVALAAVAWVALYQAAISWLWLLAPLAGFVALLLWHERVITDGTRRFRAVRFYERGIARLEDKWTGLGEAGERFRDATHPYAEDLDLFGRGGLFDLLSSARTRMGEDTLARWLLTPADPETVRLRQTGVDELRPMLDLREDLAVLGDRLRVGVHPDKLAAWAEESPVLPVGAARWGAVGVSIAVAAAAVASLYSGVAAPLVVALAAAVGLGYWLRARVLHVVSGVEQSLHDLELLSEVMARLERERFTSPDLAALRARLDVGHEAPSRSIARLHRLTDLIDSRDNLLMRVVGPPLLYTTHLAFAVEAWRARSGTAVRRWIEAIGEVEALSSLAAHAWEHPSDPFPEMVPGEAVFEGEALAHPLLPASRAVRNDVRLGGDCRVWIVSGSNMSGKSTLLRTVGINAVLALSGAPVRASRLRLAPLDLAASIRVTDSLQGGTSRFYSEITRLRRMVDMAGAGRPLLFLLDELLHGTNSNDRRIGAEAVVAALARKGAIGLLTTHDLALAHISESIAGRAENVHFEDHLEEGRIHFDYVLRPGVVRKSNALELMRSIGLDV